MSRRLHGAPPPRLPAPRAHAGVVLVVGALVLAGCRAVGLQDGRVTVRGVEQDLRCTVPLERLPEPGSETELLTAVDFELTRVLETEVEQMVRAAIGRYEQGGPGRTAVAPCDVTVLLDRRQPLEGAACGTETERPRFKFTLRRAKGRLLPDPPRIEAVVTCTESSNTPEDATPFGAELRSEVSSALGRAARSVARSCGVAGTCGPEIADQQPADERPGDRRPASAPER